jgi:hypothetical protein
MYDPTTMDVKLCLINHTNIERIGTDDLGISNDERFNDDTVDDGMDDIDDERVRVSHVTTSPFLHPATITVRSPIYPHTIVYTKQVIMAMICV